MKNSINFFIKQGIITLIALSFGCSDSDNGGGSTSIDAATAGKEGVEEFLHGRELKIARIQTKGGTEMDMSQLRSCLLDDQWNFSNSDADRNEFAYFVNEVCYNPESERDTFGRWKVSEVDNGDLYLVLTANYRNEETVYQVLSLNYESKEIVLQSPISIETEIELPEAPRLEFVGLYTDVKNNEQSNERSEDMLNDKANDGADAQQEEEYLIITFKSSESTFEF